MCIVSADKVYGVTVHALRTHPDVGLNVFHNMTDMEMPVSIGQSGRDENLAFLHDFVAQ